MSVFLRRVAIALSALSLIGSACAPSAPSPTQAPAKPVATSAPEKPAEKPAAPAVPAAPAASPAPAAPAAAQPAAPAVKADDRGKVALDKLIAQAKQEPVVDITLAAPMVKIAPRIGDAFKKRFGLDQLKFNGDTTGGETAKYQAAIAETKAGARPTFDALQGGKEVNISLKTNDGNMLVDDWELLLAEINPVVKSGQVKPDLISPKVFAGRAFLWTNRTMSILYNTKLIKENELPTTRREWSDPKWAGKYAASTFITEWNYALLFYDKEELLQMADRVGKNAVAVLTFDAQIDRMLLGEFAMGSMNTYQYFAVLAKDKNAPIGMQYFKDFSPMTQLMYTVRKGAKAPASATLFSLWATTPEFHLLHQPDTFYPNIQYGDTELDNQERTRAQQAGTKFVTWLENDENAKMLDWLGTSEGRSYSEKLSRAITQRQSP